MRESQTTTYNTLTELLTEKESTNVATIIFYNGNLTEFKQNYEIVKSFGAHIKFLHIIQITENQKFTGHDIILLEDELEDELTDISEFVCSLSECNINTLYVRYLNEDDIEKLSDPEKKDYFQEHKEEIKEGFQRDKKKTPQNINDKINLNLKKKVNTLILYTNFDSFREIHRGFFTLLSKDRKKPGTKFRFLTDITCYQGTETDINNLCIAEKRDKNEVKDILEKICHDPNFAHISSISFLDDNNNILTLDNRGEIQEYLSSQSVRAMKSEPAKDDSGEVPPYKSPDPLEENCSSVSYDGQAYDGQAYDGIPYDSQASQQVMAMKSEPDPENQSEITEDSLGSQESIFSTTVGRKRKITDSSHAGKVVAKRKQGKSEQVVYTP